MRLLQRQSNGALSLAEDRIDEIPPYAILSHTWGADDQEVTLQDIQNHAGQHKEGYEKLTFCGKQAAADSLHYFWVDTCCIDKPNYTELSEAINSMFRWYRNATKCYVYLPDVFLLDSDGKETLRATWEPSFRNSRWFTRGWTLQELIAPKSVSFFSAEGRKLGDKASLEKLLHDITGIPVKALQGNPLSDFGITDRLSWQRNRRTKRAEDRAYSLLGIFDIHLPLIYGEGEEKAFRRLRQEIGPSNKRLRVEKEDCLRSLAFGELHARRNDIVPAHPDTCDWLFKTPEFQQWRDPAYRHAHHGVLWIKGKPGAGKSTLMKHALSRYQQDFFRDHLIVAYFFNARGETLEKTPLGLLRSIVYQLLKNDDELYEYFSPSFHEKQRTDREAKWQWHLSELQEFVRFVVKQPCSRPLLLLVDALDECDESDVRDVVGFLELLSISAFRGGIPLEICLSSRHYPSIRMDKVVELAVEKSPEHQTDIAKYIGERLRIRNTEMEAEIAKRADNVFLWIVIVVTMLNKAYDEGRAEAMQKTLEEIPSDLEKLFSTILDQDVTDVAETVLMLQWVLLSQRPLKSLELFAAVVRVVPPSVELIQRRITTSSKGLIEVRKDEAKSVQFIHLSVSDFLFRQKRLQRLDPDLGPEPVMASHGRLWTRCWSCIQQVDTTVTSTRRMTEMKDKDAFLGYAASHILDHAERAFCQDVVKQDSAGKWGRGEDSPESSNTSQQMSIEQWLREPGHWFRWWKLFLIATGSSNERCELEREVGAGLLYILALRGLPNLLRVTLKYVNVHAQGGYFGNALRAASWKGNQEIVRLLLEAGADVHAQGNYVGDALQAASMQENQEIVRLILEAGANVHAQGGDFGNALQAASWRGTQEIVRLLLEAGADVNAQGGQYGNALQAACASEHYSYETVELLLEAGANVHAQGGDFGNALQAASFTGHREIVRLILEAGADVYAQGGVYGNALQAASYMGRQEIVRLLLEAGADVYAQGGVYGNALQAASWRGTQEIVRLLLEAGADVNAQGGQYGNALQAASSEGEQEVVRLLLNAGADANAQGGQYGNALQAASVQGHQAIVLLLRKNGAGGHEEIHKTKRIIRPEPGPVSQAPEAHSSRQRTLFWWNVFFLLTSWLVLRFFRPY